ncbi:MAG: aldehyde dehydrogenase family protein [Terriglobia bacterium]
MPAAGVEEKVEHVASCKEAWRKLGVDRKLGYLLQVRANAEAGAADWARTCGRIRGIPEGGSAPHLEGAAWLTGVALFGFALDTLIRSYETFVRSGSLPPATGWRDRPDGGRIATLFPSRSLDRVFAPGYRGEIWFRPCAPGTQSRGFAEGKGGVCGILGAGNYEAPLDVLSKMFIENKVVVYKPNPVNAANRKMVEGIFAPLIRDGYLAVVSGGSDIGQALLAHPAVDEILLTGGIQTYNQIMWGADPVTQQRNRAGGRRQFTKQLDAELGGVAPVIVVPGQWTEAELDHHAAQVVAAKMGNAGHICASPQALVLDKAWPQRKQFLDRIRHHLFNAPPECSYYPGAQKRQQRFHEAYPQAEELGPQEPRLEGQMKSLFIPDVPLDSFVAKEEAFCLVLAETSLEGTGGDPGTFLARAVDCCNQHLYGTLSCTLLADPRTQRNLGSRLDDAIAALHYGTIGVNTCGLMVTFFPPLPWGAYPGHTPEDIQSGVGTINNTLMFEGVEKSVLWTPFVSPLHPQPGTARDKAIGRRMGRYALRPSYARIARLVSAVVLGI